jgi:hypothetical protein
MQPTAAMFTSAANARSMMTMPVACATTAWPRWFPWLAAASSVPVGLQCSLGGEFAVFAEQARERARRMQSAGLDDWPDDRESGCG